MLKLVLLLCFLSFGVQGFNINCDDCERVGGKFISLYNSERNVDRLKESFVALCDELPAGSVEECRAIVADNIQLVLSLIRSSGDSKSFCKAVLCTPAPPKPQTVSVPGECMACTYLVGLAENWLKENATEEKILGVFEQACSILPATLQERCHSAVEVWGKKIIQMIMAAEDPKKVCTQLKLCTSMMKLVPAKSSQMVLSRGRSGIKVSASPIPCALCTFLIKTLEGTITQNSTEAEILAFAEKICTVLPNFLKPSCKSFVDSYIPKAIQMIINKETPEVVCDALSLCGNNSSQKKNKQTVINH